MKTAQTDDRSQSEKHLRMTIHYIGKHLVPVRREAGRGLIEAALILVPVCAGLLALVHFSMPIFVRNTVPGAVWAGARYQMTDETVPRAGQGSIRQVVQQNALDFVDEAAKMLVKYSKVVLEAANGNKAEAARMLGIQRSRLAERMSELRIQYSRSPAPAAVAATKRPAP